MHYATVETMSAERRKQIERDAYYMGVANAVALGADCSGSKVGAIAVVENRVLSTGYNGTPTGFANCLEGGCVRCNDSLLYKAGRADEMTDETHVSGAALDRCICVHAEKNAFLAAARFGGRSQWVIATRCRVLGMVSSSRGFVEGVR